MNRAPTYHSAISAATTIVTGMTFFMRALLRRAEPIARRGRLNRARRQGQAGLAGRFAHAARALAPRGLAYWRRRADAAPGGAISASRGRFAEKQATILALPPP